MSDRKRNKIYRQKYFWLIVYVIIQSLVIFTYFAMREKEELTWPYTVTDSAERVSLTEVSNLLKEDSDGRRAAVMNEKVYVETIPGAGLMSDETASEVTPSEQSQTASEDGSSDVMSTVVYAELPFPSSTFIQDVIMTSDFEIEVFVADGFSMGIWASIVMQLLFFGLIIYMILSMTGRVGGSFGTEKGFEIVETRNLESGLEAVAGLDNARTDVQEVISLLKNNGNAAMAGGRLPRGLLLDGPPGTGKTLLARAMAREAGVNYIRVDASSLSQMFVGLGAMKVRKLFRKARNLAPVIVFIDEIDAIGGARGNRGGGDQDRENTLNALLTELDGFEDRSGIFIIAATNRPDMLDSALTRPGRIDRRITMGLPDIKARTEILEVHCKGKRLADDVDLYQIASTAYQMSGADIENLVNEAALFAGRSDSAVITMDDFKAARDRLLIPRSGGATSMLEDERRLTAYHEAGHAVAAILNPNSDPVEKVTIAPQGGALGYVLQSPDRDRVFEIKARLKARLSVAVAGRSAERLIFGDEMVTTGAASDIRQATALAKAMVTQYGMSAIGFVYIDGQDNSLLDINKPVAREIEALISEAIKSCDVLLDENRDALETLAQALLERETLSGDETRALVLSSMADIKAAG
ncbi:ATP-dependent metallopeptidase FtsH/Yme1/Tma family protein [Pseudosulfitobacter pseudonitzschiae]|uniref:ATP-dependent metallopeptidase FtsH/Yme1/Tma family protein n=1 Tax=Pseudosulfitobacter pseudonitzschiae TaxID=1402135 RepID=UPI003B7F25DC